MDREIRSTNNHRGIIMMFDEGVSLAGITPEMVLALVVAEQIMTRHGCPTIVTSVVDGEHMHGSLHYVGAAADIRTPENGSESITDDLARSLGNNYDVVLEESHIHIEFQPKHGANPDAGSDDGEPEREAADISGEDDSNEGSSGEDTVDSAGAGAEPDSSD